jgi:hypothetical protein
MNKTDVYWKRYYCHFRCCIAESFSRALVAGAASQVFSLSHHAHSRVVVHRVDGKDDAAKKEKKNKTLATIVTRRSVTALM